MRERNTSPTRLEQQVKTWRCAAICLGALAIVSGPLGVALAQVKSAGETRLRSALPSEVATIDIPVDTGLQVTGEHIVYNSQSREHAVTGAANLAWSSGLSVRSDTAILRYVRDPQSGRVRVFIEPKGAR